MKLFLQSVISRLRKALGLFPAPLPPQLSNAARIEKALALVAAEAVPVCGNAPAISVPVVEGERLATRTDEPGMLPDLGLSTLNLRRHRPSMLAARLRGVAKLNPRKGRKARRPAARGRVATPRPVVSRPVVSRATVQKRSPTVVATKARQVTPRKAVTRVISKLPKRPTAIVVRLHPCAPKAVGTRLKRAA